MQQRHAWLRVGRGGNSGQQQAAHDRQNVSAAQRNMQLSMSMSNVLLNWVRGMGHHRAVLLHPNPR
jgi:hypothetical protein